MLLVAAGLGSLLLIPATATSAQTATAKPAATEVALPELLVVGRPPLQASFIALDQQQATFRTNDRQQPSISLSPEKLVRWSHATPLPARQLVVLSDGSILVAAADWSRKGVIETSENYLIVKTDQLGKLRLPRRLVQAVILDPNLGDRQQLLDELIVEIDRSNRRSAPHTLLFRNGDRLQGKLEKLTPSIVSFVMEETPLTFSITELSAVRFGDNDNELPRPRWRVTLRDGSRLNATNFKSNESSFQVTLSGKSVLAGSSSRDVRGIEAFTGDFAWLSELEPHDFKHVPMVGPRWQMQRDRDSNGKSLRVAGKQYRRGIAMHSASRLSYRLTSDYTHFAAQVGLEENEQDLGSVTFGVYVARSGKLEKLFLSDVIRGGDAPLPVRVNITGSTALILTVDYADRGDEFDRATWLDARLEK